MTANKSDQHTEDGFTQLFLLQWEKNDGFYGFSLCQ